MSRTLTAKQAEFARLVGHDCLSQAEAYRRVYSCEGWSPEAIGKQGYKTANRPGVRPEIDRYVKAREDLASRSYSIDVKRLMATYVAIAMTDPNELTQVRVGACRHCWSEGHAYHWKDHEYLDAVREWESGPQIDPAPDPSGGLDYRFSREPNPACPHCEGEGLERLVAMDTTKLSEGARHLYRGAQPTKYGTKILFADKDKALEMIGRMIGAFSDRIRVELDAKIAHLKLTTTDPAEAARAYQEMIKGT